MEKTVKKSYNIPTEILEVIDFARVKLGSKAGVPTETEVLILMLRESDTYQKYKQKLKR